MNKEHSSPLALIVEDDKIVADFLSESLRALGYRTGPYISTGSGAIEAVIDLRPDLIIMDINLHGPMDGIEAAELITERHDIPIVFLSGISGDYILERVKKTKPYGYLNKPVRKSELKNVLETVLYKHQADRRLRESEQRYRTLFETMAQGVVYHDSEGNIISANPAACRILGLSQEEFINRNPMSREWAVIREDGTDMPGADHPAMVALRTGRPDEAVMGVFGSSERHARWLRVYATPMFRSGEDKPYQVFATFDDITDLKTAENRLRESEGLFRSFVENAADIVYSLTPEGIFTYVSPNWLEFIGEPAQEAMGAHFGSYVHPDDIHLCEDFLARTLAGNTRRQSVEYRALRKDGTLRWHTSTGSPLRDNTGRVYAYVGVARDITEKKKNDEALRESKQQLDLALGAAAMGVWDWDISSGKVQWAGEHASLFGVEMESFGGTIDDVQSYVHPDDREKGMQVFQRTLEGLQDFDNTYRVIWPDGSVRWLRSSGKLICGTNGDPERIIGVTRDITEEENARKLLLQAEKYKAIADLSAGVAHNFNNILQIILGNANLCGGFMDSGDMSGLRSSVDQIIESSKFGAETVRRLNNYAGAGRGEPEMIQEVFDLSELAKQAVDIAEPFWKGGPERQGLEIALTSELAPEAYVKGNKVEIFEVVLNLIKNASEALSQGGEIKVTVGHDSDHVMLRVMDNGPGIDPEDLSRIFTPFFTTKVQMGAGLGLALAHTIAQKHNGNILAHSEPGGGAQFSLQLPRAQPNGMIPEEASGTGNLGSLSVLLVDDMEAVLKSLKTGLEKTGHTVMAARSGIEALKIFDENQVDIVVCDLAMPAMSGWEVGRSVKLRCAEKGREKTPFLILTGWGDQSDRKDMMSLAGIDAILEKPVDLSELNRVMARVLPE
jgi:PAS domain S-box-containing protein